MLKRLLVGLFEGALPGAVVAFALTRLVGGAPGALGMYAAAALVGVLTGLWAGRPIWAKAAKLEALLKAAGGMFIAVVVLFAMRKWMTSVFVNFAGLHGTVGSVPIVALPVIGAALALVLEIDDAFGADPVVTRRIAEMDPPGVRVATEGDDARTDEEASHEVARRRSRG